MRVVRKYTLTELLVVMAIMGILLGIAMPAFEKLTKGNNVTAATNSISTALGQARSSAILQRQYVALLLPTLTTAIAAQYRYKSYRICYVKPSTAVTGAYEFVRWADDSMWHFLPVGVILAEADGTKGVTSPAAVHTTKFSSFCNPSDSNSAYVTEVDCSDIGIATKQKISGVVFSPYGGMASPTADAFMIITEGNNDNGTAVYTNKDSSGNPTNYMEIGVARFTGRNSIQ